VALGGGHGLHASLSALRLLDVDVTAVVTVADDGGSSGRIRRELGVLPPGDLRMALSALATGQLAGVGDPAGGPAGLPWSTVLQHRMGGAGALAGHPIGNLLLTGLMELHDDAVTALDAVAGLVGARGRVLPMSARPLDLIAEVTSVDPDDPVQFRRIRGQSAIAATSGRVKAVRLLPANAPACPQAVQAILAADAVILGPGSWFTSVIPHLLVRGLATALTATEARLITVLNLEPQVGETDGFSPEEHLTVLQSHLGGVALHTVIADEESVVDRCGLLSAVRECGAELVLAPVAEDGGVPRHDPARLAGALREALGSAAGTRQGMEIRGRVPQPLVPGPVRGDNEGNAAHGAC
jgi:uncharacterized cofD-like protein